MASSLSYSTFESNQSKNLSVSKIQSQSRRKNKTIKKKPTKKAENFLNSINDDLNDIEDSESGLADFIPISNPVITKAPNEKKMLTMPPKTDEAVSVEAFQAINENDMAQNNYQQYMNTYVPYYSKPANQANLHGSKDQLMKKLNYMIHLLEKQEDEKTSNVTEELVLYMFLGVFTIFCVDSFARAGKYTR